MVHIVPERLPDMTMPRSSHSIFYANGELTVTGGHTTNFMPTPTAEYFADGRWHQMPMAYTHDGGFAVVLRSGGVIIGGGHDESLGVGQTFMVERYNAAAHTFEGFGCLDRRRALANATQLADGRVIIAGNHFADDAIACYDGRSQVQHMRSVSQGYDSPYILHTARDNAIVIAPYDNYSRPLDTIWANPVKGEAFRIPLLEQWKLLYQDIPFNTDVSAIDDFTYLLPATDEMGQSVIVLAQSGSASVPPTTFSLLPTVTPLPRRSPVGPILYKSPVVVDRQRQRGYVIGTDSLSIHQYILTIDYATLPAALTLYYTDSLEHAAYTMPVLTPDGDLILAGGIDGNNYKPLASVWCYHFATPMPQAAEAPRQGGFPWLWVMIALVAVGTITYIIINRADGASEADGTSGTNGITENQESQKTVPTPDYEELLRRLCALLEERQLYLASRLRLTDVAAELGVSVSSITDGLTACRGITFTQLLAEYRVRHAQQLMTEQPDMKIAAVISASGFTSESTFFRTFKAVTGLSPKEWLAQQ